MADLKITGNLQKGRHFCNALDNPVLITPEILPIKGKTIKSCFLGTAKMTGSWRLRRVYSLKETNHHLTIIIIIIITIIIIIIIIITIIITILFLSFFLKMSVTNAVFVSSERLLFFGFFIIMS